MAAKKFTVLIIPEGSHRVRRLQFDRRTLSVLLAVLLVCLGGVAALVVKAQLTRLDAADYQRLRSENREQRIELAQLSGNLDNLSTEMRLLAQNDAKVRVLAKLTPASDSGMAGVGGAAEIEHGGQVSALQKRIDEVRQQIDLRRESQEEVQGFLNDQRSLSAAKPTGWPVKGWVTSTFGMRNSPFTGKRKMHEGMDIAARTGTPVYATADGIVVEAGTVSGYGKLVIIDHGYGYKTYYAHNSKLFVKVGQRVRRHQRISAVGSTGSSTGSHCHYEVRRNNVPINPRKFL